MLKVCHYRQLRSEAYIKYRLYSDLFQPAVQIEVLAGEIGSHRRGDHGDDLLSCLKIIHKHVKIIQIYPCLMSASCNAIAASDTHIGIDFDEIGTAVVAELHWAGSYTCMTVYTLFTVYLDHFLQAFFHLFLRWVL
ncbi:MAG: hypothetical protein PHO83_06950 [Geobacteraceae bacterium]|nr:hypothetical protein [Geobacteraceae bacterium]